MCPYIYTIARTAGSISGEKTPPFGAARREIRSRVTSFFLHFACWCLWRHALLQWHEPNMLKLRRKWSRFQALNVANIQLRIWINDDMLVYIVGLFAHVSCALAFTRVWWVLMHRCDGCIFVNLAGFEVCTFLRRHVFRWAFSWICLEFISHIYTQYMHHTGSG